MGKRLPYTPKSNIMAAIRRLFLRSREHQTVLKRDNYSCCRCGVKRSKAKGREQNVEVHHKKAEFNKRFKELERLIRELILVSPDEMETLCKECHLKEHAETAFKSPERRKVQR